MTSCSWIMPACTREKESKKQSQRAVQRCSTFQPIVQTSTPSNSSLPNSNPSCARSPPILSKASHSRSTACARPSSLASTRSHVQNAPHISPIRGMGNLNGKCSSVSRIGDSASVQAATRVNVEQASKRKMCRPIRLPYRGRLKQLGDLSEEYAQLLHRGIGGGMYTRKAYATREAPRRGQR